MWLLGVAGCVVVGAGISFSFMWWVNRDDPWGIDPLDDDGEEW